jgi:hypothetical protein
MISHAPGIILICGPGPLVRRFLHQENDAENIVALKRTIRKFLNTLAVHIEGIIYPLIGLTHFFSCQCSFKFLQFRTKSQAEFQSCVTFITSPATVQFHEVV